MRATPSARLLACALSSLALPCVATAQAPSPLSAPVPVPATAAAPRRPAPASPVVRASAESAKPARAASPAPAAYWGPAPPAAPKRKPTAVGRFFHRVGGFLGADEEMGTMPTYRDPTTGRVNTGTSKPWMKQIPN